MASRTVGMRSTTHHQWSSWTTLTLVCFIFLVLTGTLFVYNSSLLESFAQFGNQYGVLLQHLSGLALGVMSMTLAWFLPARWMLKISPFLYLIGLLLLLAVFVPGLGVSVNGASRWIQILGVRLQPVEFFKPSYLIFLAWLLQDGQRALTKLILTLFIPTIIILLQPDLGSLLILIGGAVLTYILSGASLKKLGILALAGLPLLILAIVLAPYRLARLTTFFNPESDPLGASFHIRQITLALGQGGWLGKGIGNSAQKFAYIPETSTDSIFAIVGEEVGFLGSGLIIVVFGLMLLGLTQQAVKSSQKPAVRLAKLGLVSWLGVQIIFNLASVVGLVPLTGIPLPLFSYGRSAQVVVWWAVGFILKQDKAKS